MPERHEVISAARSCLGVPWRDHGRDRAGIDCIGLIIAAGRLVGVGLHWPEMPYRRFPPEDYVRSVLETYLIPLKGSPEPGDVALIRWRRTANHLAIVADGDKPYSLIHSYYVPGRVVEHRADRHWHDRIVALYAFRGVVS